MCFANCLLYLYLRKDFIVQLTKLKCYDSSYSYSYIVYHYQDFITSFTTTIT